MTKRREDQPASGPPPMPTNTTPRTTLRGSDITPLDRLIIDAVVDSRQGVEGALSEHDLSRAVDEFVNLNGRRHQSHFHAGLRDALFDLPIHTELSAQNEARARWYWAGVIQGLADSNSWARIAEKYDDSPIVRALGDGADPTSRMAGIHVAKALVQMERTAELPVFVTACLAEVPAVYQLLLDAGTASLRSHMPGIAKSVFALLMTAAASLPVKSPLNRKAATVRRRMAHCLRLLGESQRAEEMLDSLLRDEGDPDLRAMVHADLGLLKGRFTLLDDVRILDEETERRDLVDRLRDGKPHFDEAVADQDVPYGSHGHYCLGVLALADDGLGEDRFETAARHLEVAHAGIHGNASSYPETLVARTNLYLGLAKVRLLNAGDIHHAVRLVNAGLQGARIPRHLIESTVEGLALSPGALASVVEALLESGEDRILDALAETEAVRTHKSIAVRLLRRAKRESRPKALRAADLRAALRGYLGVGDVDTARCILDTLEQLAVDRIGRAEFVDLLNDDGRYDPAWDWEDATIARARCWELDGEYTQAAETLKLAFFSYMAKGDIDNATGVFERVKTFGLGPEAIVAMKVPLKNIMPDDGGPGPQVDGPAKPVTVLVVGGNEVQEKFQSKVRKKVEKCDPAVTVEFLRTGWESNWGPYVDEIKKRLAGTDGVVVMRFIRTTLGREVRALCGKQKVPWRFCWPGGQGGQVRAVLEAAKAAQ